MPQAGAVCIDCDLCDAFNEAPTDRKPDFVILFTKSTPSGANHLLWFVVEMKAATAHPGRIIEQLQAGATMIQNNQRFAELAYGSSVFPLVIRARRGRTKKGEIDWIERRPIRFMGKRTAIDRKPCGFDLRALA